MPEFGGRIIGEIYIESYSLIGGLGNDALEGADGRDSLSGQHGLDTLAGVAGDDRFEISAASGADLFTDFTAGAGVGDVIRIVGLGTAFDTFAEVLAATTQVGADAVIDLGSGRTITLAGVAKTSLVADDFAFG